MCSTRAMPQRGSLCPLLLWSLPESPPGDILDILVPKTPDFPGSRKIVMLLVKNCIQVVRVCET